MLNNLKRMKSEKGFTIIEVLIVLAIAGLILVIVFLAVPALQRSQRNNGRQAEASRLASAITNFTANNSGTAPASASDVDSITGDFGAFKYMTGLTSGSGAVASQKMVAGQVSYASGANTKQAVNADALMIDSSATCGAPSTAGVQTAGGTARQVALIYTTESSGGNYNQVCIQAE